MSHVIHIIFVGTLIMSHVISTLAIYTLNTHYSDVTFMLVILVIAYDVGKY